MPVKLLTIRRRGLRLSVWRLPVRRHRCGIRYRRYGARRIRRCGGRDNLFFRRYRRCRRRNRIRRTRLRARTLFGRSRRNGCLLRRNRLCAFLRCPGLFGLLCHRVLRRRCIRRMEKIILKICYGNLPLSFFSIIVQDFAFAVNTRFGLSIWAVCRNAGVFVVFPGKM